MAGPIQTSAPGRPAFLFFVTFRHAWMEAQLAEHKTEPNSGLGRAIPYLRNHWPKLTLFLQQPGARSTTTSWSVP